MQYGRLWVVVLTSLVATAAQAQTRVYAYSWENGGTILGKSGYLVDATNVTGAQTGLSGSAGSGTYACPNPQDGSRYLHVAEAPHGGTPQAYLAFIENLNEGDQVYASFYGYDETAGSAAPAMRIWGHWAYNGNVNSDDGTAGGSSAYTGAAPWSQVGYTWTVPAGKQALVIEARLYSSPTEGDYRTDYWIDNLSVTVPNRTGIAVTFPGGAGSPHDPAIVTDINTAEKTFSLDTGTTGSATINVTALQPISPTVGLRGNRLYATQGTPSTADDVEVTVGGTTTWPELRLVTGGASSSGLYAFTFTVTTSWGTTSPLTAAVAVQKPGFAIITEIMYKPVGSYQGDWEYVEIQNIGEAAVALDTLFNLSLTGSAGVLHNLANAQDYGSPVVDASLIPAGQSRVVMENTAYRSTAQFLNAWNSGAGDVTYPTQGGDLAKIQRQHLMVLDYVSSAGTVAAPHLGDDSDALFLMDQAGNCLDAVVYHNGTNYWPASNDCGSIFLDAGKLTALDNDSGANWRLSATGVTNGIAYTSAETFGPPRDSNVGSPALIPSAATAPVVTPTAVYQVHDAILNQGQAGPVHIELDPAAQYTAYKVVSEIQGFAPTTGSAGVLKDGSTLAVLTPGATLSNHGHAVLLEPNPAATGRYAVAFATNNGQADSPLNYVSVFIQGHNRVAITEIMYNPSTQESDEWEWVEVANLTASDVAMHSLLDSLCESDVSVSDNSQVGNLIGVTLPANGRRVFARAVSFPVTNWFEQWHRAEPADVVEVPSARWAELNNTTLVGKPYADRVLLLAADGSLLDVVTYDDKSPWPSEPAGCVGHSSIYYKNREPDTFANDSGANWSYSVAGTDKAYATADGADFGSPGILLSDTSPVFDFDGDGVVDLSTDFGHFTGCASGPRVPHDGSPNCVKADYDGDGDVDMADFAMFQICLQPRYVSPLAECLR